MYAFLEAMWCDESAPVLRSEASGCGEDGEGNTWTYRHWVQRRSG